MPEAGGGAAWATAAKRGQKERGKKKQAIKYRLFPDGGAQRAG